MRREPNAPVRRGLPKENARAVSLVIKWDDEIEHHFTRCPDGSWNLRLENVGDGTSGDRIRIVGYQQADMDRVLGTALKGTPDPRVHDDERAA